MISRISRKRRSQSIVSNQTGSYASRGTWMNKEIAIIQDDFEDLRRVNDPDNSEPGVTNNNGQN